VGSRFIPIELQYTVDSHCEESHYVTLS